MSTLLSQVAGVADNFVASEDLKKIHRIDEINVFDGNVCLCFPM